MRRIRSDLHAMAYKRNPMRSERIASLSRYVMADVTESCNHMLLPSGLRRTLDDSANKSISIPEGIFGNQMVFWICI